MALIDKTILARSDMHLVLAEHSTVHFSDRSNIHVHRVDTASGLTTAWLRAIRDGSKLLVFDCMQVVPDFKQHFKTVPERDNQGTVLYGLRFSYPTASLLLGTVWRFAIDEIEVHEKQPA